MINATRAWTHFKPSTEVIMSQGLPPKEGGNKERNKQERKEREKEIKRKKWRIRTHGVTVIGVGFLSF